MFSNALGWQEYVGLHILGNIYSTYIQDNNGTILLNGKIIHHFFYSKTKKNTFLNQMQILDKILR